MPNKDWQEELRAYFECIRVVERCREETLMNFGHFSEFIVEPAFEALQGELKARGLKTRLEKAKGRSIGFHVSFPGDREDQYVYELQLPKNSIELRPKLVLRGRRNRKAAFATEEDVFRKDLIPAQLLKLTKEDLILDFIERYKTYVYEAMTSPD